MYKIKHLDNSSLDPKPRLAPHDSQDVLKYELCSDCALCSSPGIRIVISVATLCRWCMLKIDVKPTFLQRGTAERDVYVIPPAECHAHGKLL